MVDFRVLGKLWGPSSFAESKRRRKEDIRRHLGQPPNVLWVYGCADAEIRRAALKFFVASSAWANASSEERQVADATWDALVRDNHPSNKGSRHVRNPKQMWSNPDFKDTTDEAPRKVVLICKDRVRDARARARVYPALVSGVWVQEAGLDSETSPNAL